MVHRANYIPLLLLLGLAAAALLAPLSSSLLPVQDRLLVGLSEAQVGGGRFFRATSSLFDPGRYKKTLAAAEVFLLSSSDSTAIKRLRALIDAGEGRLHPAAKILQNLNEEQPDSAELLNDLGVVYLGLGDESPTNYFRAAGLFERSASLAPRSPVPRFNASVALRKAQIHDLSERALNEHRRLGSRPFSRTELPLTDSPTVSSLIERLERSLETSDISDARALLGKYPLQYRKAALDYALNPPGGEPGTTMPFVLNHLQKSDRDQTMTAIFGPLQTAARERVATARRLVQQGVRAYLEGRNRESSQFYAQASAALQGADSPFDNLWIKLKSADTQLRVVRTDPRGRLLDLVTANNLIEDVIIRARALNFEWLVGQALVSKSQGLTGSQDYEQIVVVLQEAINKLSVSGTPEDLVRPLNYLATVYSIAGDYERSLDMAYRTLQLTHSKDHVRLAQLYWLAGLQLYRMGFIPYAKALEQQAAAEAQASNNQGLIASITPYLAIYHVRDGDYGSAERYLSQIRAARDRIEDPAARETTDLSLNLLCSQMMIARGDLRGAEDCLQENLRILNRQARAAPDYFAETLLQLAEVYSRQNRIDDARQQLRHAMDVIERNDSSLAATALRMPFENQRRNIYDLAIAFEYDHDAKDVAWSYARSYRSKLFLEFLRRSSGVGILDRFEDRYQVQRLIPEDLQVLEYVMLKDRLLIWIVSRDKFFSVAVPASREDLEERISKFLARVNRKADIRLQSAELYKLLIQPVESQLDPNRTLAIVPDLALHRLNFAALYSADSKAFLIQQYTILESPNLTTLLSGRTGRPVRAMAVAFGARTDNIGASRELESVQKIYGSIETFNGQTALKPAFLSSLAQASVFHYAGHSQDAADPLRSSVLLDGEREGPNSVTAIEISKRRMPANSVVVLASCDSSVGNSRDGIGMRGLTSAFLIGGAGSVVGSLWLVDSESTSRLVLEFHRNFAGNHQPVATALRNAQLAFIAEGTHPYYWSGFVVTGNTSALR